MRSSNLSKTELAILVQNITKSVLTTLGTPIPSAYPVTAPAAAPKRKVTKEQVARINRERDKYFKRMGFGKYRKAGRKVAAPAAKILTKKQARKMGKAIGKASSAASASLRLAKGRDAYFKKMGYGKYRKAKKAA